MDLYDELPLFTGILLRFDAQILATTDRKGATKEEKPVKSMPKVPEKWNYAIDPYVQPLKWRDSDG
jgi:hypothetical protein